YFGLVSAKETDPVSTTHITQLQALNPAQETDSTMSSFAQNCLACHLAAPSLTGAPYTRLTGCAACHTSTINIDQSQPRHHLSTAIAYSQCNACHNRGTYNVHTLQFQPRGDQPGSRQHDYYLPGTPAATCEYRLDCVDCHTREEIMGDGHVYGASSDAQYIQCRTCHGTLTEPPLTYTITQLDDLALRLAALNPAVRLQTGDTIIVTERGEPLWNTRQQPDGTFEIVGKVTGQHQRLPLVKGSGCRQDPNKQEATNCHACHTTSD
ncbi:MAG TPA: multiheme c-type cytochrome, partial [Anaerolineae bacterium]|nr:multiheme c-type cytochrome [Anaerolineae bacterium]